MKTMLCTLVLNEMEWLPKLVQQHIDWPGLDRWVFVEAADRAYADANPEMVTERGLSVDGTTGFLRDVAAEHHTKVQFITHGWTGDGGDQGKCAARNRYLEIADDVRPDYVLVLDADEFYTKDHQLLMQELVERDSKDFSSFLFRYRNIWHPPKDKSPIFSQEVKGGFWAIGHCHGFLHQQGMRYGQFHMAPEINGQLLNKNMRLYDREPDPTPECVHMAFASKLENRRAKHRYYEERGEGKGDGRGWYVASRKAWETWQPGDELPKRNPRDPAWVQPYQGPIPECFK